MKSKRVLIVDDHDANRKLFETLIGHLYSHESAKNGLEAVELVKNETFDLILMDIQMPVMDGITAMKKIRQENPTICPILAVTAFAKETDRGSFLAAGFDDIVTKPIQPREFLKLIQDHLGVIGDSSTSKGSQETEPVILDRKIFDQLLKYNSSQAIRKIFDEFLVECSQIEIWIETPPSKIDRTDLLKILHTFKGNSGTLGAMGIFHSAKRAEEVNRNGKPAEFDEEMKKMKNEIQQFRDFFNRELTFDS